MRGGKKCAWTSIHCRLANWIGSSTFARVTVALDSLGTMGIARWSAGW